MSRADLKEALVKYYEGYQVYTYADSAAEDVLSTKISNYRGKKTTVISKIAREENFTAEETAAFRAGLEKFDAESLIEIIKNGDYEFHPDANDFIDLGDVLREQLVDDGLIPKWIMDFIDSEKLGAHHILIANEYVFSEYGYFEVF